MLFSCCDDVIPFFADFKCYGYDETEKTTSFEAGEDVAKKTMEEFLAQKKRYKCNCHAYFLDAWLGTHA